MTPEEKAKELGIPLIPALERPVIPLPSTDLVNKSIEEYKAFLNKTVAICGGCGKEIKVIDKREPCGSNNCPFGFITN